ncbi:hypothetical protein N7471_005878 [Penicillium samsonianum]|uniref:uncharacterized protein n=1 Tax=Penicillium samsonianum TaxID=1882272 RepID=UPI00254879D2|nr:uncharacterized protein N7471_005878 [Penicillium samsonianum]KAJ6139392.1 hypothetical protein N7471_005878 [Penicillium samsonianum]
MVYSTFEIVQPMVGTNASAILSDLRGVRVSDVNLQSACAAKPAWIYTHEGVMYNPLAWALAIDEIMHDGPAHLSWLDLEHVCRQALPPAL